jgi:hypothetical protein
MPAGDSASFAAGYRRPISTSDLQVIFKPFAVHLTG